MAAGLTENELADLAAWASVTAAYDYEYARTHLDLVRITKLKMVNPARAREIVVSDAALAYEVNQLQARLRAIPDPFQCGLAKIEDAQRR